MSVRRSKITAPELAPPPQLPGAHVRVLPAAESEAEARRDAGLALMAEYENAHGVITEQEMAAVEREMSSVEQDTS